MKILITGAKGFVGRNLVENLKNIRDGKDKTHNISRDLEILEYDIDNTLEQLDEFCKKADFVFNSMCSIIIILIISILFEKISSKQLWLKVGKYTFTIYILSLPVQNIVEIFFLKIGINWIVDMIGMFLIGIAIPFFIGIFVNNFEKNKKIKWYSKIIGIS